MRFERQAIVLGLILCGAVGAHGADRYVAQGGQTPAYPYTNWTTAASNIQAGIVGASAGCTVWVSNGVYVLTNQVTVTNFAVRSYNNGALDRNGTVVNGNFPSLTNRCFYLNHTNAMVEGFTITNGCAIGYGGGVWIGAGTLRNCLVTGNTATNNAGGGGVYATGASSLITDCDIIANRALGGTFDYGGGGVMLKSGACVKNSRIMYNQSPLYWTAGGAVHSDGGSILNCSIISNTTVGGYNSGGVFSRGSLTTIRNCLIMGNGKGTVSTAGGVGLSGGSYGVKIENCTIVSNAGCGLQTSWHGGNFFVTNTIIYGNAAGAWGTATGIVNGVNCCVSGTNGMTAGSGNFTNNPQFVDAGGRNYRLATNSPCVNAGTNLAWMGGTTDLDGSSRLNGDVDIGCYERPFLVQDGQVRAEIVITNNPPRMVTWAARELQTYLQKITGATVPIVTTNGTNVAVHLYVGRSGETDKLGLSDEGLDGGAFRIVSSNNWMAFLGKDTDYVSPLTNGAWTNEMAVWDQRTGDTWGHPMYYLTRAYCSAPGLAGVWAYDKRGSMNAVHEYLRNLGCRWYFPGDMGEVVPSAQTLVLPGTNALIRPDFAARNFFFYYKEYCHGDTNDILWQWRLGINMGDENLGVCSRGHGIQNVINRMETATNHPEYYKLLADGRRDTPDIDYYYGPCLSSTGLYARHTAYLDAVYAIYNQPSLSVGPTDGYAYKCNCPLCAGKDAPGRYPSGHLSDYVWGYANTLATDLLTSHPGRKVDCLAYTAYLQPPTNIASLSSNLTVTLCQWRSQFYDPAIRTTYTNLVAQWLDKAASKELYIWDYYLHGNHSQWEGVPVYFPHLIATNLCFLKGKSQGEFIEVYRNWPAWSNVWHDLAANHLNVYVTSRLWWNANQDVDTLLEEYYTNYYGPAASQMRSFIQYCETNWPNMRSDYTAMCTMLDLLDAARAAAGSGVYSQRIDLVNTYVERLVPVRDSMYPDRYVAQNGQVPASPYVSWDTAASNIQDAVNVSYANGTVWVGAGRYTAPANPTNRFGPNVVFINKMLTLRSSNGVPESVIIDGQGTNRGIMVLYQNRTASRFVLEGITLANGYATNSGGGLYLDCRNGTAFAGWTGVVQNCVIVSNRAGGLWTGGSGGGVYGAQYGGNASEFGFLVSNTVIRDNQALYGATNAMQAYGGGLYVSGRGTVADCTIFANKATCGGGVYNNQALNLWNCSIVGNSVTNGRDRAGNAATHEPKGGGVYSASTVSMRSSLLSDNSSLMSAGGAYLTSGANELCNCTVTRNYSGGVMGNYGGTLYVPAGSLQVVNSIVVSNTPAHARNSVEGAGVWVTNSCLIPINYGSTNAPSGLVTNAPGFVDYPAGNFRLSSGSPCLNTGTNQEWMTNARDLNGLSRIMQDVVDMGAYEYLMRSGPVWTAD